MLHLHVIDELRTGGAQTHLITMLREAISFPDVEHHVVSLFGDGELSEEIRSLGVQVHILDLRPHFRKRKFLAAAAEVQKLIGALQPDLVEAHLTWSRLIALFAAWRAGVSRARLSLHEFLEIPYRKLRSTGIRTSNRSLQ